MIKILQDHRTDLLDVDMQTISFQKYKLQNWWKDLNFILQIWDLDKRELERLAKKHQNRYLHNVPDDPESTPDQVRKQEEFDIFCYFLDKNNDFEYPLLRYHIQKLECLDYFNLRDSLEV